MWDYRDEPDDDGWTRVSRRRPGRRRSQQQPNRRHEQTDHRAFGDSSGCLQRRHPAQQPPRHRSYAEAVRAEPTDAWRPQTGERHVERNHRFQQGRRNRNDRGEQNRAPSRAHNQNHQNQTQRSNDPDFAAKVRVLNRLLKATHHLKNVADTNRNTPAIQRIATHLATVIKPAAPSSRTLTLIDGNARSWAYNTVTILKQHYEDEVQTEKETLKAYSGDFLAPLEIATKWIRRNLGNRFQTETLNEIQTYVLSGRMDEPAATPDRRGNTEDRRRPTAIPNPPPPTTQGGPAQRTTSPTPDRTTSATMTEPIATGWSPTASDVKPCPQPPARGASPITTAPPPTDIGSPPTA
ncbi:uncharacterized protein [Nothobranchius furzeri]|uniref:uncharacterized protein n=1 Tax=Nothobranchius furzeri TaxID=105023 RepID=UPI0039047057